MGDNDDDECVILYADCPLLGLKPKEEDKVIQIDDEVEVTAVLLHHLSLRTYLYSPRHRELTILTRHSRNFYGISKNKKERDRTYWRLFRKYAMKKRMSTMKMCKAPKSEESLDESGIELSDSTGEIGMVEERSERENEEREVEVDSLVEEERDEELLEREIEGQENVDSHEDAEITEERTLNELEESGFNDSLVENEKEEERTRRETGQEEVLDEVFTEKARTEEEVQFIEIIQKKKETKTNNIQVESDEDSDVQIIEVPRNERLIPIVRTPKIFLRPIVKSEKDNEMQQRWRVRDNRLRPKEKTERERIMNGRVHKRFPHRAERERLRKMSERDCRRSDGNVSDEESEVMMNNDREDIVSIDTNGSIPVSANPAFGNNHIRNIALRTTGMDYENYFTFQGMLKGRRELGLKRVENTDLPPVIGPLGTDYDRVLRMFLFTDTGKGTVELVSYEGYNRATLKGFVKPSAIAVITPGSHFAVLDANSITLIDVLTNTRKRIADGLNGKWRGLAKTSDGNLASLDRSILGNYHLCVWNTSEMNTKVCSIPYLGANRYSNPSFLCTRGEMIYVTDLGNNSLSSFEYHQMEKMIASITSRNLSNSTASLLRTEFISGCVADNAHMLMVADASGRSIHLVSPCGSLIQTLPFINKEKPYISGLSIAPTGRVGICCRRDNCVQLYDLVPIDTVEDKMAQELLALGRW